MIRRGGSDGSFHGTRWGIAAAVIALVMTVLTGPTDAQVDDPTGPDGPAAPALIGGTVANAEALPVIGVSVDLFTEGRATYLRSASTGANGTFVFDEVDPGCYVVTFIAPPNASFDDGSGFQNVDVCVVAGEVVEDVNATVIDRSGTASIIASVQRRFSAEPVGGVVVDLFTSDESGNRIEYLQSGTTPPPGGGVEFAGLAPGCYTLTFIAPDGAFFTEGGGPSQWNNLTACAEANDILTRTATIDGAVSTANLDVIVTDSDMNGVGGVVIDLFSAAGDGTRAGYLGSETTSAAGVTDFRISPGCYVAVVIAPEGQLFPNGSPWAEVPVCLEPNGFEAVIVPLS